MSPLQFISVGLDHLVQANRILTVFSPKTVSGKRYTAAAKKSGHFVDASVGRKVRSIILMDEGLIVLSAISSKTLLRRLNFSVEDPTTDDEPEDMEYVDTVNLLEGESYETD